MTRTEILNYLIKQNNFKSYLEIGVQNEDSNFNLINCQLKMGVDPNGCTSFTGYSDEFFNINKFSFDLVFIDGDHREAQVTRDINNSLRALNKNGIIVLHDSLPVSEEHQSEEHQVGKIWAGTVWKSLARLRIERDDLDLKIVNTDWGCSILRYGKSTKFQMPVDQALDYTFFYYNAYQLFTIISSEEFLKYYE